MLGIVYYAAVNCLCAAVTRLDSGQQGNAEKAQDWTDWIVQQDLTTAT